MVTEVGNGLTREKTSPARQMFQTGCIDNGENAKLRMLRLIQLIILNEMFPCALY